MGVLSMIVLGLAVGVVARFLYPGKENMGFVMTILLGIAGSFLAGVVGQYFGLYRMVQGAGFIGSVVGAFVLLYVVGRLRKG